MPPAAAKPSTPPAPDDGWDSSPTQVKDDPDATAPRVPSGGAAQSGGTLSTEAREQVWAIVRAAVDEALAPLKKSINDLDVKSRTLEAKLEELERRPAPGAPLPAAAPAPAAKAAAAGVLPASGAPVSAEIVATPGLGATQPLNPFLKAPSAPPVWKVIGEDATGLVNVSIAPPPPPLPGADRSSPLPGDLMATFDAGRKRKRVSMLIVAALLLFVGGLVTMTVLSYR